MAGEEPIVVSAATLQDWDLLIHCFDASIGYQKINNVNVWMHYDQEVLKKDISLGNLYKVTRGGTPGFFFSVTYRDPVIWREQETGNAIYLHRMVVNPACKGERLFGEVVRWATKHAADQGRQQIRMDTWADNTRLIAYYCSFGFRVIEYYTTPDTSELPVHNRNLSIVLLEMDLKPAY